MISGTSLSRCTRAAATLLATLLIGACEGSHSAGVRSLAGTWAFHPGDDSSWASPSLNDSSWVRLSVPGSWGRQGYQDVTGIAWYRLRVNAPWPAGEPLGITIGKVTAAYEIFVDGVKIGGMGQMPPTPEQIYDRHATYIIPFTEPHPNLTIALRVWRPPNRRPGEAGPTNGPFEIGPLATLLQRAQLIEVDRLILFCIFMAMSLYLFGLWLLRPRRPSI